MDPTYNARMLKEKKFEMYPDPQMLSKLLPTLEPHQMVDMMNLPEGMQRLYLAQDDINQSNANKTERDIEEENIKVQKGKNNVKGGIEIKPEPSREEQFPINLEKEVQQINGNQASKEKEILNEEKIEEKIEDLTFNTNNSAPEQKNENELKIQEESEGLDFPVCEVFKERENHLTQGITPNEMVEVITELTNPQTFDEKGRRKKGGKKTSKKKLNDEKISYEMDNPTKIKIRKDDFEEKNEEETNNILISANDFKIHIEKEGKDFKIKKKGEESQE